ncbi:MAG: hypothetical protein ACRD6X_16080 [Pyrinomonadaceae bacterium]
MYVIALFGLLLMLISFYMIAFPCRFAAGIVVFSEKAWFHPFEIVSRFVFGLAFAVYAGSTIFPTFILAMGVLLIAVSIGLLLTPPSKHREFAVWSAERFKNLFRPLGFLSLVFGAFITYTAFGG